MVHLIEVDMIGLESFQRAFHRLADVQGREPRMVGPIAHAAVDLCRKHRLLAAPSPLPEPTANNLLCPAFPHLPTIGVGSIEEIDTKFQRLVHDRERIFFSRLGAEVHGAKTQTGYGEARTAKLSVFHISSRFFIFNESPHL